jgi:hypothetical protein
MTVRSVDSKTGEIKLAQPVDWEIISLASGKLLIFRIGGREEVLKIPQAQADLMARSEKPSS